MKIIWNYDDVHSDIISVYVKKDCIGYFKLEDDKFRIIQDSVSTSISIIILKQIVDEYPEALQEARKMIES